MRFYRSARMRLLLSTATVAALVLSLVSGLGGLPISGSELTNLPDSVFESKDGNLSVDTAGNKDWLNAPNRASGAEKASGQGDDAFGGGAKEDIPNPKVVSGSIPNNKSDLTRFYVANEAVTVVSTNQVKNFLYLAWERANTLGSANIDFEFNQSVDTGSNKITPVRTAGDVLITYDFEQGGSTPSLGLLLWVTDPNEASQCFSSNAVPCWGKRIDLSAAKFAEGSINLQATNDPITNTPLPQLTFGEAAIDLNAAGVFQPNVCTHFGRSYVKSRSSTSFPAELKDFIAPIPVNIDTCGSLKILKNDDQTPGNRLPGATFTISPNPETGTGSLTVTDGGTGDADGLANGEVLIVSALPVQYTVVETAPPAGWVGSSASLVGVVGASGEVTVGPFVNTLGSIAWEKRDDQGNLLGGATFSISPNPFACRNGSLTSVTDNDANDKDADAGQIKLERVCVGTTYTITETNPPSGYAIDSNPSRTVTPTGSAPNQVIGTQGTNDASLDFHDRPLLKLLIQVVREDNGAVVSGAAYSLSSMNGSGCTFTGAASQTQTTSPTVNTGVWDNLQYSCMSSGPGYQVTVKTPGQ